MPHASIISPALSSAFVLAEPLMSIPPSSVSPSFKSISPVKYFIRHLSLHFHLSFFSTFGAALGFSTSTGATETGYLLFITDNSVP